MSLDRCKGCDGIVDTDQDGDCYFLDGMPNDCRCERCREKAEAPCAA